MCQRGAELDATDFCIFPRSRVDTLERAIKREGKRENERDKDGRERDTCCAAAFRGSLAFSQRAVRINEFLPADRALCYLFALAGLSWSFSSIYDERAKERDIETHMWHCSSRLMKYLWARTGEARERYFDSGIGKGEQFFSEIRAD